VVDAEGRRPTFTKRKEFGAGAKSNKFVIQDIVSAGEIKQQVVGDPIQRARVEIANCVLVKASSRTARI
jgi:hypothetical protein